MLDGHGGDVDKLKDEEPWLFAKTSISKQQGGTIWPPNASTSPDKGKTMKRRRKLAGLDDSNE
ncbi:hypothetical protein [Slackia exigua]|uniref:hypothetical protein n=1 Tax=Slackia exigua TaxID=84109 RepID=UPI003AB942FA